MFIEKAVPLMQARGAGAAVSRDVYLGQGVATESHRLPRDESRTSGLESKIWRKPLAPLGIRFEQRVTRLDVESQHRSALRQS